jgi:hypothetical protein
MQQVWPDSFVEEANPTVNISALCKVLGETPGGQRYIETVPKRGEPIGALAHLELGRAYALFGRPRQSQERLYRLSHALKRRRPGHPAPEASQSRIREGATSSEGKPLPKIRGEPKLYGRQA